MSALSKFRTIWRPGRAGVTGRPGWICAVCGRPGVLPGTVSGAGVAGPSPSWRGGTVGRATAGGSAPDGGAGGGVTVTSGVSGRAAGWDLLPGPAHPLNTARPRSTIRPASLWLIPPRAPVPARLRSAVEEEVARQPVGARARAPRAAPPALAAPAAPATELWPDGLFLQLQAIVRRGGGPVAEVSWGHRAAPRSSRFPGVARPDPS